MLFRSDLLRGFYESAGFEWLGKSNVVHGSKPWYEMRRDLNSRMDQELPSQIQQLPPGIWDALQRRPNAVRLSRLLSDFPNGVADLTCTDGREGVLVNKFDLLCPKINCGSAILKNGVGTWVERSSIQVSSYFPWFDTLLMRLLAATSEPPEPSRPSASPRAARNSSMVANNRITYGIREYWVHTSSSTPYKFR